MTVRVRSKGSARSVSAAEQPRSSSNASAPGELDPVAPPDPHDGSPNGTDDANDGSVATVDRSISAEYTSTRRFRTFDSVIEVPEFRWYLLSMTGNWSAMQMQQVVRGLLAYQITGSFAALGGVALANALPRLLLALVGGVLADRVSRRVVLQVGEGASAILTMGVAILLFTDRLVIEHLYIAAALQGIAMAFSHPARQAMIPDIVGEERLTNAIGLNASGMNSQRLLAPAIAGVLVALIGFAWVYALIAALFTLAVLGMFRVKSRPSASSVAARAAGATGAPSTSGRPRRGAGTRGGFKDMVEGFRYLGRNPVLRMLLAVHLFVVVLTLTFQRLAPGFVSEVLADSEGEAAWRLGAILAVMGGGALIGSLVIASLPNRRRGRLLIASIAVFGAALLAFAISENFWISVAIVFILGLGQAGRQSLSQILIQSHTENEYRGRISSIMMMEMGLESFGTFAIALVAVAFGAQVAFGSVAIALLLLAVVVALFLPTYRRLQ